MPLTMIPIEFWLLSFGALGAILGSYINMAAYRLPRGISTITRSRSFCPKCEHQLAWYDNIPILSYLQLRGKCRYCKVPIPGRYLATELLVTLLFCLATYQFFALNPALSWFPFTGLMPPVLFFVQLFLIVDLILLSIVDLEAWLIPVETTLPWALIGLLIAPIFPELHGSATTWFAITPFVTGATRLNAAIDSFTGLVIGAGVLWAVGFAVTLGSYYYFKAKGRKDRPLEGMGLGDVHLMAMVGAMLGWKAALGTLMLGVFIGSLTGITKILYENHRQKVLGDAYKPWQPEFELPSEPDATDPPPRPTFWMLLWMGLIVCAVSTFLIWQGRQTFGFTPIQTFEEVRQGLVSTGVSFPVDFRLFPVYLLLLLGALLVMACFFLNHLSAIDMLPQGEIKEDEKGEKTEVLHGNYVPFGPSLAAAAILVAFYDPLIRNAAYWWFALGPSAPFPRLPWNVLGF